MRARAAIGALAVAACGAANPIATPAASLDLDRRLVAAGAFIVGCNTGEPGCPLDARARQSVQVDGFWIDTDEVTRQGFASCVAEGACATPAGVLLDGTRYPVDNIGWDAAAAFCRWRGARLPTELEWEKAARGTDGRRFPWGDDPPSCARATYRGCAATADGEPPLLARVGATPTGASPYGVQDMAGGVTEWVADAYVATDPPGHVIRGASDDGDDGLTTFWRGHVADGAGAAGRGFRCARSAPRR